MHCIHNSTTLIIIFASPEALLQTVCIDFVEELVSKKLLQLFCIDEIHLFIQFGLSFRKVFQNLRTSVIHKLKQSNSNHMKIPLLLMTATFNIEYLNLLEKILGIKMLPHNIFWGSYYSFQKRHIKIEMKYSSQHFKSVCDDVSSICANTYDNKMIIISSTAKRSIEIQNKLDLFLDKYEDIKGDTVLVIGSQDTELKYAYTTQFTNTKFNDIKSYSSISLCPRFLIGTPGCIGAGLDCDSVTYVKRIGIPSTIIDFIQEVGRCGRSNDDIGIRTNTYSMTFTLNDYVYLVERLFKCKSSIEKESDSNASRNLRIKNHILTKDEERNMSINNLNEMCALLFLNKGCIHAYLEAVSGRATTNEPNSCYIPCHDSCPYCTGEQEKIVKRICRFGMSTFLCETMIQNSHGLITPIELAQKLYDYPNVGTVVYKRIRNSKRPEKKVTHL